MKHIRIIQLAVALLGLTFTSCRKDYTCTCHTVIDGQSKVSTIDLPDQTEDDAFDFCERYEDDLNTIDTGTTGCHI